MPRWLRITGIGCGGLLGLFVLVGACTAIISGPTEETPTDQAQQGEPAQQEEPAADGQAQQEDAAEQGEPVAQIGQSVPIGDVEWTVVSARQATELSSQFGDTKQGNFVIVDFNFTNQGNEAVTLDPVSLTLIDAQGRESEADTDSFGYIPADKDIFLEQVNPGVTREGQVIYTVAPDASGFQLRAGDAAIFSDESVLIDLGF